MNSKHIRIFILAFIVCSFSTLSCQLKSHSEESNDDLKSIKIEQAIQVAQNWMEMIDNEEYDQCWEESAKVLKESMPKNDWEESLKNNIPSFGIPLNRELISAEYYAELPDAPKGEYVVVQFQTTYSNKGDLVERVTPKLEKGKWRVSGFYFQ